MLVDLRQIAGIECVCMNVHVSVCICLCTKFNYVFFHSSLVNKVLTSLASEGLLANCPEKKALVTNSLTYFTQTLMPTVKQ